MGTACESVKDDGFSMCSPKLTHEYPLTQKRTEVDHKIEQLSQKAVQLSRKLSQKTIEGILFALYNDTYISALDFITFLRH